MKKLAFSFLATALFAVATLKVSAQIDETRAVSGFTSFGSGGPFNVHIKIDGTESIKLVGKAEMIDDIESKVLNGELSIQWKDNWKDHKDREGEKIDVYVTAKSLSAIESAGSNITVDGILTGDSVNVGQAGPGNITCTVKTAKIHVTSSGFGSIDLNGSADDAKIDLACRCSVNAKDLKTNNVIINAIGSPKVSLQVDKTIGGNIVGTGDIVYNGNAVLGNVKTVGAGHISKE